jgi:hypothetical protein
MEAFRDRGVKAGIQCDFRFFLGRAHVARIFKRRSTLIRHFLACRTVFSLTVGMVTTPFASPLMALIGQPAAASLARHAAHV